MANGTFPFGAPVEPCGVAIPDSTRSVFILGAYPSAFHVRWTPPAPWKPVAALPVDNEPTPFWDGSGADAVFDRWKERFSREWGSVEPARLNGSSGQKLDRRWVKPFGFSLRDAVVVDCLPFSRASVGVAKRLSDTYNDFARSHGAPAADLAAHPSENQIVAEALGGHTDRLRSQLAAASPELIITLGNAASRVMATLVGQSDQAGKLETGSYGLERSITIDERRVAWQALIHPAAPKPWQERHDQWLAALDERGQPEGLPAGTRIRRPGTARSGDPIVRGQAGLTFAGGPSAVVRASPAGHAGASVRRPRRAGVG